MMKAKLKVSNVENCGGNYENLTFSAVPKRDAYPEDGSDENNTFAKWTPTADLKMVITNPVLMGKFSEGQEFYVDFTLVK